MKKSLSALLFVCFVLPMGCARVAKVQAIEGDNDIPYDSLGTIEVRKQIQAPTPSSVFWAGVRTVTFSRSGSPNGEERYKKYLRSKLAREARKNYGADSVIHVEYWPDPASGTFPEGYLYARGEMIRYHRFPVESTPAPAS